MSKRMPNDTKKDVKDIKDDNRQQGEPLGHSQPDMDRDKKKRTVQFDEGQRFTSDEDIIGRRTA